VYIVHSAGFNNANLATDPPEIEIIGQERAH